MPIPDRLSAALADRYRIERELGAGGMATVYLAADLKHDRKVAIKVLKPELAAVLGAERFVVEIKTTAALQHPHILPLFDSGTADGFLFYVMPYIKGETIREKLNRETQFGVDEAVRIAREVADALDYAHRNGVIHRDIKPENILLHDGRAMVMDFGIALAVSAAAGGRMTETGLSLGTPHYMSPEQATAEKEITARSDVYSLASVLYEMLAGQPPHIGGAAQQVIMKIITEQAQPVTNLRKSVPSNVAAALAKALEKLPADRFESAKTFSDALGSASFTSATTVSQGSTTHSRAVRPATLAIIAACIAVATIGGFFAGRSTAAVRELPVTQYVLELPDSMTAVNRCCGPSQVISPDGKTIVFVGMQGANGALYRRSVDQLDAERIPGTDEATIPTFSPDGRWVLFEVSGQLKKVPLAGGPVVPIVSVGDTAGAVEVAGAAWMTNDTVAYIRSGQLWLVGASGGAPVRVPGLDSSYRYRYPSALPGNRHVLMQSRTRSGNLDDARVVAVELKTGHVDTVAVAAVARYSNGSLVMGSSNGTILVQPFDLASRKTIGNAITLPSRASVSGSSLPEFAVSDSGWLEYEVTRLASGSETLRMVSGSSDSVLIAGGVSNGSLEDPAIAPDGKRIMVRFATGGGGTGGDLWLFDMDSRTPNRFTVGGALAPVWSRDGQRVAYVTAVATPGIYIRPVDQTAPPQLLLGGIGNMPGAWTPDNKSVVFSSGALGGPQDIGIVTIGDTVPKWLVKSEFSERQPQLSSDGTWLAYTSNRTGRPEVYVQSMSGVAVPVLVSTGGGASPRWSRTGRTLFYYSSTGELVAAAFAPSAGITVTNRTIVTRAMFSSDQNTFNTNWDVFPDGKHILFIDQSGGVARRRIAIIQNWPAFVRQMGAKQ